MLDLDYIADEKARSLNQTREDWRKAVWSPEFQKFTSNLSDGEIENVISWCPSVDHLNALVRQLSSEAEKRKLTPFAVLTDLAKKSKVTPEKWIVSQLSLNGAK